MKVGKTCITTATLFDLKTETTERATKVKSQCSDEDLMSALEKITPQIVR